MEEKLRFVFGYERDEQTMTELCQSFGIAREIGYVWQPASLSNRCKIMGREHPR